MKYDFNGVFIISQKDLIKFSELIGDNNPIHLNEDVAINMGFEKQIVHGVLLAGVFSKHFGTIYPGNRAIYLGQTLIFRRPVYPNKEYTYNIALTHFDESKNIGKFETHIYNALKEICVEGEAKLKWKK